MSLPGGRSRPVQRKQAAPAADARKSPNPDWTGAAFSPHLFDGPIQRKEAEEGAEDGEAADSGAENAPANAHRDGEEETAEAEGAGAQEEADEENASRGDVQAKGGLDDTADIGAAVSRGIAGGSRALPHLDAIQRSFEHHDVTGVEAHVGDGARDASAALGAEAFATGNHVVFGYSQPSLHTAAHEAAHVVQQRAGVSLAGGIGADGDPYERHADAVADRVVRGESAADLLDTVARSSSGNRLGAAHAVSFLRRHRATHATPGAAVQRRTSNGVSVSGMRFSPVEIPADGATTSQGSVQYSGRISGGATLKWSIIGAAHGSTVSKAGLVTPGKAITKGAEKVKLKVKAEDSVHSGAHTFGHLTLWDADFLQAKKDYPKFIAGVYKKDPYTAGINGKMALEYNPRGRRLQSTVRVSFTFKDDKAGAAKWNKGTKAAFKRKFIRVVQNRWSGQYRFENVREPKKIWKKLNPVSVRVRVKEDTKAPHFAITIHKKAIGAQVVAGTARFGAGDDRANPAFNPATGAAEVASLAAVTPTPIAFAAGSKAIPGADKGKLDFMATYLRRIGNPRFHIDITGRHAKVVHPPGATNAQKRKAERDAKRLSTDRANAVFAVLRDGGATANHRIRRNGVGDAAPAADSVDIASKLPPGWQNVQTTLEHEAGHMLGIGDEYVSGGTKKGDKTSHYTLTMNAFGKDYADKQARRVPDSASLMNGGNDIRPHHYVTLWDGLAQLTGAAAVPVPPFGQADWKFAGGT